MNMRAKVSSLSKKDKEEIGDWAMRKCKAFYATAPFSTKVYMAMKTGISITFIIDNWNEIVKEVDNL